MDHNERVAGVARELAALNAAVAGGPVDAPVPTCPDWTVVDLAQHVGGFCGFWAHVLCDGNGCPKATFTDPPSDAGVVPWLAEMGAELLTQLEATPGDTPVWTWFEPDQSAGFVARRAVNELAIHRYDAQSARGTCTPIEPALAIDGIDETFDALVTRRARTGEATGQTIHLHGTDDGVEAEWLVTLLPDRIDVARTHAKGDLAIRGAVSDLELHLFQRPALGVLQQFGDTTLIDAWYREFNF
jgi:uncharacterized protein (TIGR03083 family)